MSTRPHHATVMYHLAFRPFTEKSQRNVIVGCALFLASLVASGCNIGGLKPAPYQPPAVGTVYRYSGGITNRITSVDKWRVGFVDAAGNPGSRVGLFISEDPKSPAVVSEADLARLWPLELNKEFTMKVERNGEVYSWNFRVTSEQTVLVANGKYDAYVVQAVQTPVLVRDPSRMISTINTWWYAPELGAVARFRTTYTGGPSGGSKFESALERIQLPNPMDVKAPSAAPGQIAKP